MIYANDWPYFRPSRILKKRMKLSLGQTSQYALWVKIKTRGQFHINLKMERRIRVILMHLQTLDFNNKIVSNWKFNSLNVRSDNSLENGTRSKNRARKEDEWNLRTEGMQLCAFNLKLYWQVQRNFEQKQRFQLFRGWRAYWVIISREETKRRKSKILWKRWNQGFLKSQSKGHHPYSLKVEQVWYLSPLNNLILPSSWLELFWET